MDAHVLIPLIAVLAGSAFAGTLLARGARSRVNHVVAQMLFCASGWALTEFMVAVSADAASATFWLRASVIFSFGMGPLAVLTLMELRPELRERLRPVVIGGAVAGAALAALALITPLMIHSARPMSAGGWTPQLGSQALLFFGLEMVLPIVAMVSILTAMQPARSMITPMLAAAIGVPIVTVLITDILLPITGVEFHRLGATTTVLFGGSVWLYCYRALEGPLSDSGFARAILANLPDGVMLLERDGHIRSANTSLARMVGRDARDLIGRSIDDLLKLGPEQLHHDLTEREALLIADGGETVPVAVSSSIIRDRQEGAIGHVLVVRDLRAVVGLRRHMVASGRLAAVGELAAGIAHEVNNPIAFMQSNLNLLSRHYEVIERGVSQLCTESKDLAASLEAVPRPIEDSLAGIARVAAIVRDVRSFAHAGSVEHQSCDVNELLESTLRLATLKHEFYAEVERDYGDLPPLQWAGQDLKQVFLSLIRRATEVVGAFGHIKISTRVHNGRIEVHIGDDGAEVSEAELQYLDHASFDPVVERPASLELGISQQIVQEHGGNLTVERDEQGWTRVCVSLPLMHEAYEEDAGVEASTA